jgi:hypothetical protein
MLDRELAIRQRAKYRKYERIVKYFKENPEMTFESFKVAVGELT